MSRLGTRFVSRQLDVVEWAQLNKADLKKLAAIRYAEEKGVFGYCRDFVGFVVDWRSNKRLKKEKAAQEKALKQQAETEGISVAELKKQIAIKEGKPVEEEKPRDPNEIDGVAQYYASQDLIKRMKWKRVSWDADADFEAFSRRVLDNDTLYSKCAAYSFMSIHLVHDPRDLRMQQGTTSTIFTRGCLTDWVLKERDIAVKEPFILYSANPSAPAETVGATTPAASTPATQIIKSAAAGGMSSYTVDWVSGEGRISDCISAYEMYLFLNTVAPRLQAIQVRMDAEQTKLIEDLENCRVRLGVSAIHFNKYDRSVWDDPARKTDPNNYVNPEELREFIDNVLKRAYLLRTCVKGHCIRVVKPGQPYKIDMQDKEIHIPVNFADYNYLRLHGRYESLERFFNNCFRKIWNGVHNTDVRREQRRNDH